jgi:hypothetical protein
MWDGLGPSTFIMVVAPLFFARKRPPLPCLIAREVVGIGPGGVVTAEDRRYGFFAAESPDPLRLIREWLQGGLVCREYWSKGM